MFTGIIGDVGEIRQLAEHDAILSAQILTHDDPLSIDLGASIACDGVCLTVTQVEVVDSGALFHVDISQETLQVTNLGRWVAGSFVNLERAMRIGEEIGGHIVSGHVDGLAEITNIQIVGGNHEIEFCAPIELAKFIAAKGSVALNGTSLTVNKVHSNNFVTNLIPHTLEHTTWNAAKPGDFTNLEVDMMARYVARLREFD